MELEFFSPATVTAELSQDLTTFYRQFNLGGLLDFQIQRQNDFFNYYSHLGEDFRVYTLRDKESKKIEAMATFVIREGLYEGEICRIATATDLRVSNNRRTIVEWGNHFLPVMKAIQQEMNVQHIFSHINMTETTVMNTFLRPRNMRRPMPRYYLYRKYSLNTLHGHFPWAPKPLRSLKIRQGSNSNEEALIAFLAHRGQFKPFASVWSHESFVKKISRMKGFSLSDFLIAFDSNEKIIGCMAPWSTNSLQHIIPQSYGLVAHNFRQFLKFGNLFNWTRPLTKPFSRTQESQPLNFRWLTHINVDNEDVLESLLYEAYHRTPKNEFLIYPQAEQDFRLAPPLTWVYSRIPYALYSVLNPEHDRGRFLDPSVIQNPEIDVGFI